MHLHTLRISAIGPFPDAHTIDFAELGSGGIFLLEGPTGAGKSTIIDAIVFALYGKVASKGASEDRLRSSHVGPEVESSVDLVFETGHGIYRILRKPAYDRPSKRGSGTVRQNMQVQLWRLTSPEALNSGDQLSTRADEVGAEVTRLVGLSREQFVQTIVLPQGEFANFLSAKPEERRGLLQRVFGTEIYERIQAELVEARKLANQKLADAKGRIRSAVDTFCGAANLSSEQAVPLTNLVADGDTNALHDGVAQHLDLIAAESKRAAERAAAAAAERDKTQRAEQAASALLETVQLRNNLAERSTALNVGAEKHENQVSQRETALKASQVTGYLAAADRAIDGVAAANTALSQAFTDTEWLDWRQVAGAQELDGWQLGQPGPLPGLAILERPITGTPPIDVGFEITARQERVASLNRAAELEQQLPVRTAELEKRDEQLAIRSAASAEQARALETRPDERRVLDERRAAALRTADTIPSLTERLNHAQSAHTSATRAADVVVKISKLELEIGEARDRALAAETRLSQLRRARIEGIAGELAAELRPGEPCVVCGATEHPAPAALGDDHVSAAAVTEAEQTSRKLEQNLSELATRRTDLAAEHARHVAAAGERSVADAKEAVNSAQADLAEATAAQQELNALTAELADFDALTEIKQREHATEKTWLTEEAATLRALSDSIATDRAEVQKALETGGTFDSATETASDVTGLILALSRQINALTALTDALGSRRRALIELDRATDEATGALAAHGFADVAAARAAALPPNALEDLARDIKAYEAERTLVTSGLAEASIVALDPELTVEQAQIDVELAHKLALEAATYFEEASKVSSNKEGIHARAATAATSIADAITASAILLEELTPTLRIANLADASSSDNTQALTLGTYVLTRRFEEVLGAANNRLREMSSGRYELQRSAEKESHGGRRLGLALRVLDHNTASHRDPATLSGGETFYVSLCLALGLADIVTAEAGGVDLGTLFVDEGFGSLDPETLDLVLAELGKLRTGGRMVGVVSHVEAMKSTISDRICVRRQEGGASTLTVLAGTN